MSAIRVDPSLIAVHPFSPSFRASSILPLGAIEILGCSYLFPVSQICQLINNFRHQKIVALLLGFV
jgi:hypothetical protein